MTFAIHNGADGAIDISTDGAEAVRFQFNPSGLDKVNRIKTLTAALITELQNQQKEYPAAGREFAVAITNAQTASMWAVLAATKGL
jgi:hypothetical protein